MSANRSTVEKTALVKAFNPQDIDGATLAEDYVSMKNYENCEIVIEVGAVGADFAVTVKQATAVAGTGEKALGFGFVWRDGVKIAVTSDTFTITTAADAGTIWVIPIEASELDVANDFTSLRVDLADPSVATLAACHYRMGSARYAGSSLPSAIVD